MATDPQTVTPDQQRVAAEFASATQHVDWLLRTLGPRYLAFVFEAATGALASLGGPGGTPLHPEFARLRDAAAAAQRAFAAALHGGIVLAPADALPPGGRRA